MEKSKNISKIKIGDKIKLLAPKPRCTLKKEYIIFKKVIELKCNTEYWFYNDRNQPALVYKLQIKKIKENGTDKES